MAAQNPTSTVEPEHDQVGTSPVERAFHLLQLVVAADDSIGVRELSRRSGLPRSTVSRSLGILADLGMVSRNADGSAMAGSALATLQPAKQTRPMLADILRPLLTELVSTFGENAALSVDDGDALLYVSQVLGEHPVSVPDVTQERHHFHLVAPGLITMAWWKSSRLTEHLRDLESATEYSVTSPKVIRARLRDIRSDGFCWTNQELDVGVNGFAVPVIQHDQLVATISLFAPAYRFNPEVRPSLGTDVIDLVSERLPGLLGELQSSTSEHSNPT